MRGVQAQKRKRARLLAVPSTQTDPAFGRALNAKRARLLAGPSTQNGPGFWPGPQRKPGPAFGRALSANGPGFWLCPQRKRARLLAGPSTQNGPGFWPGPSLEFRCFSYWKLMVTAVRRLSGSRTPSRVGRARSLSPRACVWIAPAAMPRATRASRTTEARRSDRPILYWAEPEVSVWPTTSTPETLHSRARATAASIVSRAAWLRFERSHSKYTTKSDVGHATGGGGGGGGGGAGGGRRGGG